MNSKRLLFSLLQLIVSFSLLFVHQTIPALSIIEESVKELIVERTSGYYDLFTLKMKTDRFTSCNVCNSLGALHVASRVGCKCECRNDQPYTFLSSIQRCANTTQVHDFGGKLSIHHTALSLHCRLLANGTVRVRVIVETNFPVFNRCKIWTADNGPRIAHRVRRKVYCTG